MRAEDKTYFIFKPAPGGANGVAQGSFDGVAAGLKARGVPDDRIVAKSNLHELVHAAAALPDAAHAAFVLPGGNALTMKDHIARKGSVTGVAGEMMALLKGGASCVAICAGSILVADKMVHQSLNRRVIPQWIRDDMDKNLPRGGRENVRAFLEDQVFEGEMDPGELTTTMPKAQDVPMLGLAVGVDAEAFAYFAAHAGRPAGTFPAPIEAPISLRDGSTAHLPNIAGPRFTSPNPAHVQGNYKDLKNQPASLLRIPIGEGQLTMSAPHPELPVQDGAGNQADRDRMFNENFDFDPNVRPRR